MEFSLYVLCVIICHLLNIASSGGWSTTHEALELISVSRFEGLGKYYCQLKEKSTKADNRLVSVSPKEDTAIRRQICRNIFRSNYFEFRQEEPVNVRSTRIQHELKLSYPRTYDKLYTESRVVSHFPLRRHYDNPYKLRSVFTPGYPILLKEYVFLCPVREHRSNKIKEYYVSAQYNVNDGANYFNNTTTHITGRFIFQPAPKPGALIVHALAEESAKGVLTFNIDMFYFLKRGHNSLIEKARDDPICKLSNVQKLRLCTTLFTSYPYKTKVKFVPGMDSVEGECKKREITFFTDTQWSHHFNGTSFHEWMFVCKAMIIKSGKWVDFYVSRGYGPNRVFVYKHTKGKLLLYHHSVSIGEKVNMSEYENYGHRDLLLVLKPVRKWAYDYETQWTPLSRQRMDKNSGKTGLLNRWCKDTKRLSLGCPSISENWFEHQCCAETEMNVPIFPPPLPYEVEFSVLYSSFTLWNLPTKNYCVNCPLVDTLISCSFV